MSEIEVVSDGYRELFGNAEIKIVPLPQSGSDRKYFRIFIGTKSIIGAFNANFEENEAFIGFTKHFISKGLPVPEIYGYLPEKFVYFLQDLGDNNLYTWLHKKPDISHFDSETKDLYRKILDKLILFQTIGIDGLNLELCYPHKSFDRQSMMWDLNYFKYMLLKLLAVPFRERLMEHDFNILCDYLLDTGQDYFLYRDFQTANVMVMGEEPWFIDYQGGRKGAAQYDVASLLYDAKIPITSETREELLDYYVENFCSITKTDVQKFKGYYAGFSMIRLMQALGAFGFRGLYEQKPTFTDSIVPAVNLLLQVIDSAESHINLPELFNTIREIPNTSRFAGLLSPWSLKILIMKAMIFAAGLGKRLGAITQNIPKALVDINGKTALQRIVEKCSSYGFDDIIINVHHFADMVEDEVIRLNKAGFRISVSDEREKLLENGGGLYKARDFFGREPFLLHNVDIISDLDLSSLFRLHIERKGLATLAVRHRAGKRFLLVDENGQMRGWRNIITGEQILTGVKDSTGLSEIAFSSMHIVEPEIFNYMNEGIYSMVNLYLKLATDHNIYTLKHDEGYWVDVGTPESLDYVRQLLLIK